MQIQAVRELVSCKTSSQGAGLVHDKQPGVWSRADTSSQGAGLVQDKQSGRSSRARQAVRVLVSCKISSQVAGLVQDKQSGCWSNTR